MAKKSTTFIEKIFDFLASLKLAVIVIISIAVASAVGTIVEARYDTQVAHKLVYQSIYMYLILGTLCVNLIFVMIDRWPWKKRHTGFVLAHIGIILTLLGALITSKLGVDGSMAFGIGESNQFVTLPGHELNVYSTFDGSKYSLMSTQQVDFFMNPPQKKPFEVPLGSQKLKVVDYHHYALTEVEIARSENPIDGPAVRIQLQNSRMNFSQWIVRPPRKSVETVNLGPAKVILSDGSYKPSGDNELVLISDALTDKLKYRVYSKRRKGLIKQGELRAGDLIETGWMDIKLRVLKYLPHATRKESFKPLERPTPLAVSALKVQLNGQQRWMGLNSVTRFFTDSGVYVVTFQNRRINLGFGLKLKKFNVGRYQGTMRAASYESLVEVPKMGEVMISMNEPLKYSGYTFYQASFSQDEQGNPTASILSVNKDPGRWLKYLGCFLIVLGSMILFWFKRMSLKLNKPKAAASES